MNKIYLFLLFYKSTLPVSLSLSFLSFLFIPDVSFFCFIFCTISFVTAILYKEAYKNNEFYYYHNNNFSKFQLYGYVFSFNVILSIIIKLLLWLIY
ncbi:hypothetical protein J2W48_000945 [Flavobacterium piscis]|uniref:Uncharacterized protein n=1 Tax=Flavobacterium piscis TaxID=1114874 RepID=A0ABU1Y454_9FLAO|nr:hypothetical protein [Flavobacterium piscis]